VPVFGLIESAVGGAAGNGVYVPRFCQPLLRPFASFTYRYSLFGPVKAGLNVNAAFTVRLFPARASAAVQNALIVLQRSGYPRGERTQ
jgi:hypothetical protein